MHTFNATEVAFLMVACQQAVIAVGWALSAAVFELDRRSAAHWSGYALLICASVLLFLGSDTEHGQMLRALANACAAGGVLLLERGVRLFTGRRAPRWIYLALVAMVLGVCWYGMASEHSAARVAFISGLIAVLCTVAAWNIFVYTWRDLAHRFFVGLSVPLLLGAGVSGLRAAQAVTWPETVGQGLAVDNAFTIVSAMVYLVTALVFHLTLVALVGTRLVTQLRKLSRVDGLTELFNRRAIEEMLHDEAKRAVRDQRPFAVLMIDADYFKGINDLHGHAAGDDALRHLAKILRSQMRDVDRVGRFGGEEFVVVLAGATASEALSAAERLRDALVRRPWTWQGTSLSLTVSIGVAAWRGPQDQVPDMLKRADTALYRAKSLGRDRFEYAV